MKYEETGSKEVKDVKLAMVKDAERLSTFKLVWILVRRHKVALLALGNVVLLLNTFVPYWTSVVGSFLGRL